MAMTRTAVIVGAGIGGLAAGIALQRAGWRVRILERASSPRALGFGLALAPNAVAALQQIGLADRVLNEGHVPASIEVRRPDGTSLTRVDISRVMSRGPAVITLRPALYGALLSTAGLDSLAFGEEAAAIDVTDVGVSVTCRSGRSVTGDVLIGADGIHSTIRRLLHHGEAPPRRSGYYGIRGIARRAVHLLGDLSVVVYFGHRIEAATVRAGVDAVYWYVCVPEEDVRAVRRPDAILEQCAARLDEAFQAVVQLTEIGDVRIDELCDRNPLHQWGTGPVTLLGDAAHAMLPQTGQGAAQALEDAVALGRALKGSDVVGSLRTYERERARRTRKLVRRGRSAVRMMVTKSAIVDSIRARVIRLAPTKPIIATFIFASDWANRFGADHRSLRR